MTSETIFYKSANGQTDIHAKCWIPSKPAAGVIQIAHGMLEHLGRYESIAEWFCDRGMIVCANDHLGHGRSLIEPDLPMYFGPEGSWNTLVQDMRALHEWIVQRYPHLPKTLLGFSMGSFLARDYITQYQNDFDHVILIGTGWQTKLELKISEKIALWEIRRKGERSYPNLIRRITLEHYNEPFSQSQALCQMDWLCSNCDQLQDFLNDPLCHLEISAGMFLEMIRGMRKVNDPHTIAKTNRLTGIFLVSGLDDPVGGFTDRVTKLAQLMNQAGLSVTCRFYTGRHDLLHEERAEHILNDILMFLTIH